jgi:hypothetical protein
VKCSGIVIEESVFSKRDAKGANSAKNELIPHGIYEAAKTREEVGGTQCIFHCSLRLH